MTSSNASSGRVGLLAVGTSLAPVIHVTSKVQVFRYSAATWNTHRIHFDKDYALAEGYPDVLVQSHLHGALLARYLTDWVGYDGRLLELGLRVRRYATAGETLTIVALISAVARVGGERAELVLELTATRGSDCETCVTGTARVEIPEGWLVSEKAQGGASHPVVGQSERRSQ
jgi:acyl dehydratase